MDTGAQQRLMAALFDAGAEVYDTYWAPQLHRHSRDLLAALPPPADGRGRTVLDVAAGTGALLPDLRRLAGPRGRVVALDRSLGMLRRAGRDVPRVQADAAALPVRDGSADVAVYAFVLFLLADAGRAVAEAARVLRPGGWLLAATWEEQQGTAIDAVLREELDAAGAPPFPDVARSDDTTNSPERMAALLGGAFTDVRTTSRPLEARFDRDSGLALRTGGGVIGWRLRRLSPEVRETLVRQATVRLSAQPEDAFVDRSVVLLTTARRA